MRRNKPKSSDIANKSRDRATICLGSLYSLKAMIVEIICVAMRVINIYIINEWFEKIKTKSPLLSLWGSWGQMQREISKDWGVYGHNIVCRHEGVQEDSRKICRVFQCAQTRSIEINNG